MSWPRIPGKRRQFVITIFDARGTYPQVNVRCADALYVATPSLVYSVVPSEIETEYGDSENAWTDVGNIRLWGALMFSLIEGSGFYCFWPLTGQSLSAESLNEDVARHAAERTAARHPRQRHDLVVRWPHDTIGPLYEALLNADNILLRGVSCYLKTFLLWPHHFFREEMALNLYIAVEAGMSVIRRRMSTAVGRDVPYGAVFDFVSERFGEGLAAYWQECHDDRTILVHPDNKFGARVMHPSMADDIYELLDPMLSLYRYILIDEPRPPRYRG